MKKKFLFTGFVFIICLVVFIFINAKPSPMDMRFQAVAYEGDTEIEEGITIRLAGDLQENIFTKDTFTGILTVTSENYPVQCDLEFNFDKNRTGALKMLDGEKEYGILKVSKDFETVCIQITNPDESAGKTVYLAAPATDLSQAQTVTTAYFN